MIDLFLLVPQVSMGPTVAIVTMIISNGMQALPQLLVTNLLFR